MSVMSNYLYRSKSVSVTDRDRRKKLIKICHSQIWHIFCTPISLQIFLQCVFLQSIYHFCRYSQVQFIYFHYKAGSNWPTTNQQNCMFTICLTGLPPAKNVFFLNHISFTGGLGGPVSLRYTLASWLLYLLTK